MWVYEIVIPRNEWSRVLGVFTTLKTIQFVTFKLNGYTYQLLLTANIVKYSPLTVGSYLKHKNSHKVANSQKCISVLKQHPILRSLKTQYCRLQQMRVALIYVSCLNSTFRFSIPISENLPKFWDFPSFSPYFCNM